MRWSAKPVDRARTDERGHADHSTFGRCTFGRRTFGRFDGETDVRNQRRAPALSLIRRKRAKVRERIILLGELAAALGGMTGLFVRFNSDGHHFSARTGFSGCPASAGVVRRVCR